MSNINRPETAYHPHTRGAISAELIAANNRLLATRQQQSPVARETGAGWLSHLRTVSQLPSEPPSPPAPKSAIPSPSVAISTDLLLAFLKQSVANEGRVWLLSRTLDTRGQGWLPVQTLRAALTDKASKQRICGWRRLKQILATGAGQFWQRDNQGRIWLKSQARVAISLGIVTPKFKHVQLPLTSLTGSLAQAKANFYAAIHSGRGSAENPISRISLRNLTAIPERSQQRYDAALSVKRKQAIAIGDIFSEETHKQYSWEGKVVFKFTDRLGKIGSAGTTYSAWRLPNQYEPLHTSITTAAPKRLRQRINHHRLQTESTSSELAPSACVSDLAIIRAQGNRNNNAVQQCYFQSGLALGKSKHAGYLFDPASKLWIKWGLV